MNLIFQNLDLLAIYDFYCLIFNKLKCRGSSFLTLQREKDYFYSHLWIAKDIKKKIIGWSFIQTR